MGCGNDYLREEREAELQYWLTGNYDSFCDKKREIYLAAAKAGDCAFGGSAPGHRPGRYRNELKYAGDLELAFLIEKEEKKFRSVRKQLPVPEYAKWLHELIRLRNRYARTAGFENYLDYRYALWGIEADVLAKAASRQRKAEKTDGCELKRWLGEVSPDHRLAVENQRILLREVDECWNLNLSGIQIHDENLPAFYIGACVPIHIPDDVHVLINKRPGLSGFSVFLHEIGHGFYYSNIAAPDSNGRREPFNLIMEETVALLFENQVFTDGFSTEFLHADRGMWLPKAEFQLNYLLCCAEFEERIYGRPTADFGEEWKAAWAFAGETEGAAGDGWTKPHFFVSNPGYFAAYFIAGFLAKEIYRYADREGRDLFDFIRNEICRPGAELEYEVLLEKVLKS